MRHPSGIETVSGNRTKAEPTAPMPSNHRPRAISQQNRKRTIYFENFFHCTLHNITCQSKFCYIPGHQSFRNNMMTSSGRYLACLSIALFLSEYVWAFSQFKNFRRPSPTTRTRTWGSMERFDGVPRSHVCLHASSKPMQGSTTTEVLYQKVVRPSQTLPELVFLGYLVEYLESHYKLPNYLPMVYESLPSDEENRCIVAWDSPLSPSSDATRMEVEVVGIYTDGKNKDEQSKSKTSSVPNMAMVVVRK